MTGNAEAGNAEAGNAAEGNARHAKAGGRSGEVEPFLRGCAWRAAPGVPYPRFDPRDATRIPADTWQCAHIPAGVRLELVGDATAVTLDYATATDDLGYRGAGRGRLSHCGGAASRSTSNRPCSAPAP